MSLWHDTWSWPKMSEDLAAEKEPFWDLTGLARRTLCREILQSGAPDKLLLTLTTEGSEACDQFEKALVSMGDRIRRRSMVCLKAICGHVALETIQIVRVGNTDFRLSHFPTTLLFTLLPPRTEPDPDTGFTMPVANPAIMEPASGLRLRPDGFPDPAALMELAESVESGLVETQIPPLCSLEFHAVVLGLPLGEPKVWWAHLGEGRSIWDIEVQDLTIKVSIIGEVVRTLAHNNGFRQEFLARL